MKKNMAITMVKDVFKEPHFQIKPTHIIFRFLVPFLLIGIGILFYSSMQKGTPYEFPFSKEEIKEVKKEEKELSVRLLFYSAVLFL